MPNLTLRVSTHSHPKVAAVIQMNHNEDFLSFNTQPPEGGCLIIIAYKLWVLHVSTHSHPKVAANDLYNPVFCHDRFQHTATRRWLQNLTIKEVKND